MIVIIVITRTRVVNGHGLLTTYDKHSEFLGLQGNTEAFSAACLPYLAEMSSSTKTFGNSKSRNGGVFNHVWTHDTDLENLGD